MSEEPKVEPMSTAPEDGRKYIAQDIGGDWVVVEYRFNMCDRAGYDYYSHDEDAYCPATHFEGWLPDPDVTALQAKVARYEAALRPFAFLDDSTTQEAWELRYNDRFKDWIDFGDMDAARKALEETQ